MRYILVSGMHFRSAEALSKSIITLCFIFFCSAVLLCFTKSYAAIIDRVVAYVDDTAITLSEFEENYEKMKKTVADIKKEDVINSLINRQILINEAKRMRLEAPSDDEILKDYIDIKIGSLIFIKEDDIHKFYTENIAEFKGHDYLSVRDDIEKYLFNLEMNKQLKKHLEELRADREIKIHLTGK